MRFTPQLRAFDWLVARPIAHRGLHTKSKGIIENTAGAFEAAIKGNYAIECDVQLTADGEAIVFHDDDLDRLTEAKGPVKALTTQALQKVKLKATSDRMQTLAELLEQVDGRATLVIELKSLWDGNDALAKRALQVLESYDGPYCLMSFDPDRACLPARAFAPDGAGHCGGPDHGPLLQRPAPGKALFHADLCPSCGNAAAFCVLLLAGASL